VNARRVPARLAESLLSGVNALSEQTPVCLPSIPAQVATTTPAAVPVPVAPPSHHGKPPHHEKHQHGHGKHGGEGD
jgi:hypothetical protein